MMPANSPFQILSPAIDPIMVSAKRQIAKYSCGPNFSATLASCGAIKIKATIEITVPRKEYKIPTPNAFPACPCSAIGAPSNVVATEDGVPGILRRIAEIKPPDVPPTYSAISIAIPFNAPIPYVMGRQSATAMVDVNPGIEPKMMPIITPSAHRRIVNGLILDSRPAIATLLDIL